MKATWASCEESMRSPTAQTPVHAGPTDRIDDDVAAIVDLDRGVLEAERLAGRSSSDADHDGLCVHLLAVTEVHGHTVVIGVLTGHHHVGVNVDPPLLEGTFDHLAAVHIGAEQDVGQRFDDRDLGAQIAHHRGELTADGAAADDDGRIRAAPGC